MIYTVTMELHPLESPWEVSKPYVWLMMGRMVAFPKSSKWPLTHSFPPLFLGVELSATNLVR